MQGLENYFTWNGEMQTDSLLC